MARKKEVKVKGVFEKYPGVWYVRYSDTAGRIRREKAGSKNIAIKLVAKRRTEVLQGRKLPESLRKKVVKFSVIAEDARKHCTAHNLGHKFDGYRIDRLQEKFGSYTVELPMEELRNWYDAQEWTPATYNRYRTTLSLMYRLAIENGKASTNPARMLRHKREDNGRVRFLNQHTPEKTEVDYLKDCTDEESRLRAVIRHDYPEHMTEFEIALHTGMRPSEQYGLTWDRVDLVRKVITIPNSKNGHTRHIRINSVLMPLFQAMFKSSKGKGWVFISQHGDHLVGYKHWFEDAVSDAGLKDFTWYCLRHTFASRLVMAGVSIRTVAQLMGHQTIQMTMRYAHLEPAHEMAAVELLATAQLAAANKSAEPTDPRSDLSKLEQVKTATTQVQQLQ